VIARRGHHPGGADYVRRYLRRTRVIAGLAVALLAAAVVSDRVDRALWAQNPLLTNLASSLVVVALSVAVLNEALERRRRRDWSVLAQYVLFELVGTARLVWTTLMEILGLMYAGEETEAALTVGARTLHDTRLVTEAMHELLADPERRQKLHGLVARLMRRSDELLGRWAGVLLNSAAYAKVIDRHVELYSRLAAVGSLLEHFEPTDDDPKRRRVSRSSPIVELHGNLDDDWLSDNLVTIAQLAETLDQSSLRLALRLVPAEWLAGRVQPASATAAVEVSADNNAGRHQEDLR
jgi:hypothetical protein